MNPDHGDDAPCNHHWIIDSANGPTSRGTCKLCQQIRDFTNSIGQPKWGRRTVDHKPPQQQIDIASSD